MRVADDIIAALVPTAPGLRGGHIEPSPLAPLNQQPMPDDSITYAIGRVDSSGKVSAAHIFDSLQWRAGDRLAVHIAHNVIVIRHSRAGVHVVPKTRSLVIPVSARRVCGIRTGDSVLLAATADSGVLLIHPPAVLDKMMALYHHEGIGDD